LQEAIRKFLEGAMGVAGELNNFNHDFTFSIHTNFISTHLEVENDED